MSEHKPIELRPVRVDGQRPDGPRADIAVSIDKVRGVLEALRFGSITLTVHDARVVQIDVTEKTRLTAN
ncbi:YezD family protein [Sphingobium sp. CR2-8]|uniref:YezD family protein n=1 Tax=Sphingobium sp. CR2-8 TaxID=1306534 RepID=UPI002DB566FE|nr:YezD family protein [Sphingobium sp. CR2-8]MEC3910604.1 YezD family protein [Sphingobium sp. CR2-8]